MTTRNYVRITIGFAVAILVAAGTVVFGAEGSVSALWGVDGEKWDPRGRLPDYSYAGYHAGEKPIPEVKVVANVRDFGAKGDGVSDDTQAFNKAISSMPDGALLIPAGRYVISQIVKITRSRIVLRGEGVGAKGTVLYFRKPGNELDPDLNWKWGSRGLLWISNSGPPAKAVTMTMVKNFIHELEHDVEQDHADPSAVGNQLASVTAEALRGDTELQVSSTRGIVVGKYVVLKLSESDDRSLGRHLHDDLVAPGIARQPIRWPVRVKSILRNRIELAQPLRTDVRAKWLPAIHAFNAVQEVGIEDLRMECPALEYPGHLLEIGYNPLAFTGALNCWATNIEFLNADNGPCLDYAVKHCTLMHVKHLSRSKGEIQGHHGFSFGMNVHDCMLTDFEVNNWIHDVTMNHLCSGNVIRRGVGANMNFDHHRNKPFANLWSDIDVGIGSRIYESSGAGFNGPHSGAWETFWNIRSSAWTLPPIPPMSNWPRSNTIPASRDATAKDGSSWGERLEGVRPADLYRAQLNRRLGQE